MKIEYTRSMMGLGIDMSISISDFNKAGDNDKEFELLCFAIASYVDEYEAEFTFSVDQYNEIKKRLPKSGRVIFCIKESSSRRYDPPKWCEVMAISDNQIYNIVFSDDDFGNLVME